MKTPSFAVWFRRTPLIIAVLLAACGSERTSPKAAAEKPAVDGSAQGAVKPPSNEAKKEAAPPVAPAAASPKPKPVAKPKVDRVKLESGLKELRRYALSLDEKINFQQWQHGSVWVNRTLYNRNFFVAEFAEGKQVYRTWSQKVAETPLCTIRMAAIERRLFEHDAPKEERSLAPRKLQITSAVLEDVWKIPDYLDEGYGPLNPAKRGTDFHYRTRLRVSFNDPSLELIVYGEKDESLPPTTVEELNHILPSSLQFVEKLAR